MAKRKLNKHYVFPIIMLALILVIGGTLLALLVYTGLTGKLQTVIDFWAAFIDLGGFYSVLIIFWITAIPLMLVIMLIINLKRRKKLGAIENKWEEAVKVAVAIESAEREEARRKEEAARKATRFSRLNQINRDEDEVVEFDRVSTLSEVCVQFRDFAAANLKLYYSETDIREFIAGFAVSHIIILQGMSGTGKTSLAYAFGEFLGNPSTIIPVQPMWKERTDLLGYYNEFTKKFNETLLLQKMYEAGGSKEIYITVLDEMNIARVEYYFAEFLSMLEIPNSDLRYLDVVPDKWETDPEDLVGGRIKLPENMWFVGTANNDDSTFAISDKVYDRAMVLNLNSKSQPFGASVATHAKLRLSYDDFHMLIMDALESYEITGRNLKRLNILDEYLIDKFQITFGNRILRQIRNYISVYVSCGGDELDALDDILSKKVLRKLEFKNSALVKSEAGGLIQFINDLFGQNRMIRCIDYLERLLKSV